MDLLLAGSIGRLLKTIKDHDAAVPNDLKETPWSWRLPPRLLSENC